MTSAVTLRNKFSTTITISLSMLMWLPMAANAHVLSITATTPFPTEVAATSSTTATFTITNISRANITAIDKSQYPTGSGLSTSASTCGAVLSPNQTCTMQVTLQAPASAQTVRSALQVWGKPTLDGVQYPFIINVTEGLPGITLEPVVVNASLPALRDPIVAENSGTWLILSGSTGNFHQFENTYIITSMYTYNPATTALSSMLISLTNMPAAVKTQLNSVNTEYLEDGDTLYIIGGFNTVNNINFTTLNTISAINIPGMINAIKTGNTNVAPFVTVNTGVSQFQVTGGQLGKIGSSFYLSYGQNCAGDNYCTPTQVYTNSLYQFSADSTLSSVPILNTATHLDNDNSGWRRRDYTLIPFMLGSTEALLALGGPFTQPTNPNPAVVWTNSITFTADLAANNSFLNQQANQYFSPALSMYSASKGLSFAATFSGLSNLYWGANGLVNDNTTPYGNILDLISYNSNNGQVQEFANLTPMCSGQPLSSCLYMGLAGVFIANTSSGYYDSRHILQLDMLPKNTKTLVGYIYAGLLSPEQDIFTNTPPPNGPSYATNAVYAVYVVPAGSGGAVWKNITNLYAGTPNS